MNALDPTVAEFRERLKHQRTEKRRRLNAMIDGATADDPSAFFENLSEIANYYDPRAAFLRLRRHRTFPFSLRALFARCWVRYGDGCRKDVNDDLLVLDVLRCLLPPYEGPGLTLYRGDSAFNRRRRTYGMSWSASRGASPPILPKRHRRVYSDGSVLLEAEAPPDAIVFAPALHVNDYAEDEYVVDRAPAAQRARP